MANPVTEMLHLPQTLVSETKKNPIGVAAGAFIGGMALNYVFTAVNVIPRQSLFNIGPATFTTIDLAQIIAAPIAVGIASKLPVIGPIVNNLGKAALTTGLMAAPLVNKGLQILGVNYSLPQANPGIVPYARIQPFSQAYYGGSGSFRSQSGAFTLA